MIGLIGLGTMGENLVQNLASKGETVVVWNRTFAKSEELAKKLGTQVIACETMEDFVAAFSHKRNVFLLVPAGKVTDEIAQKLFTLLSPGDAIWDLGNAHWDTTIAHQAESNKYGIHWIGCGISGGSEGARLGPSMMPGGDEETVRGMLPTLEKIAAKDFSEKPCVTFIGRAAAGNFVKMVHNGIEYAIMQGIAEIYDILRYSQVSQAEMKEIFEKINTGYLKSFLLDITVDILGTKDPINTKEDLLPKISDIAGSKGTGGWTVEAALKLGVPVPTIAESLFARWMSGRNHTFSLGGKLVATKNEQPQSVNVHFLKNTLSLVYLGSYLQGLELIIAAEKEFQWGIELPEVLRIWQGGCIIRSQMLEILPVFYGLPTIVESADFMGELTAMLASTNGVLDKLQIPTPVIGSIRDYFMTLSVEKLPTNLIQAMRDSFGAHGVKRIGSEESESFRWK